MNEKKYILTVNERTPRGRRRRNTAVGSGGSVYVSVGAMSPAVSPSDGGGNTPDPSEASGGSISNDSTQITPNNKTAWRLIPDPSSVKITAGKTAPFVGCSVERTVGGTVTRFNTSAQLADVGVALWVKVDDGEWMPYVIGLKKAITTSALSALSTQDGRKLITQGNDIDSSKAENLITFALRDTSGLEKTYAAVNIPVVRNGDSITITETQTAYAVSETFTSDPSTLTFRNQVNGRIPVSLKTQMQKPGNYIWVRITTTYSDGTQTVEYSMSRNGQNGVPGASGPMVYPAGEWDADKEYEATDNACPVVMYSGQYYVLRQSQSSQGNNPAEDYATNGENALWQLMDHMSYVFADILMANFAKLGSAVFYGDYMFSQHGVTASGEASTAYQNISFNEDGSPTDVFRPNFCVNLRTGKVWTNEQELREFKALYGVIGPFNIGANKMSAVGNPAAYDSYNLDFTPKKLSMSRTKGTETSHYVGSVSLGSEEANQPLSATVIASAGKNSATAAVFRAEGATYNRAIDAKGDITTDGVVTGYGVQIVSALSGSRIQLNYSSDTALIKSSGGGYVNLPTRAEIEKRLGISRGMPFWVPFTVIAGHGCAVDVNIQGRDSGAFSSLEYPYLVNTGTCANTPALSLHQGSRMIIDIVFNGDDYIAYF